MTKNNEIGRTNETFSSQNEEDDITSVEQVHNDTVLKGTDGQVDDKKVDEHETSANVYCQFVGTHYRLAFGITLGAHILMIILTGVLLVSGYDLFPIEVATLPLDLQEDSTKLRTDAWWFVKDDDSIANFIGTQQTRSIQYQTITLVYELKDGNLFTKESLLAMQRNEDELFNNSDYQKGFCQLQGTSPNQTCKLPLSILRFFDGTYRDINPRLYDPTFEKIPSVMYAAQSMNLSKAILNFHRGKDAVIEKNAASSQYTRTLIYTGWPIEGYSNTHDRDEDQAEEIDKMITDTFAKNLEKKYKDGVENMNFYYDNRALNQDAIQKQVLFDMMLAVASFVFIFLFMWFQTGSLWLTSWGIFSVISSFNITNLIYRVVFDYRYIGIFHVLSIFIILGIGSDDIFVFMDTWKQSRKVPFRSVPQRLSTVYKKAAKTTLVTSFTTMMAFISNLQSPLLAISSFGLFAAILIAVNYISVVVFFPAVVILHHISRKGRCCCGPMCVHGGNEDVPTTSKEHPGETSRKKRNLSDYLIHFFEGWFFRNVVTHRIVRWIVIIVFVTLTAVSIGFATQLEPEKEQVKVWKSDTNWEQVRELGKNAFLPSQEDRVVVVHIIWGLKEQDRSGCHHTDPKCKGKTVFDNSFDLNPPPCQNAMLDLCTKMKSLPSEQEEKLKLRRSQVTGEVEIECIFERMNEYLKDEGNKTKYLPRSDFSFPLNAEKMAALIRANPQIYNISLPDTYYRFFEVGAGFFMTQGGAINYTSSYDYIKYTDLIAGEFNPTTMKNKTIIQGNKYGNRLLYAAIALNTTLKPRTLGYEKGLPIYENWENFVNKEMSELPSSCSNGFQATVSHYNVWHWLKVQEILVNNALVGIVIGLALALVVLTVATTNVIVGAMATLTIAMVTCSVLAIIPIIGWKLGLFESLNLTLIVGLAVDYVVHLAEGYMELEDQDRLTRVRHTLGRVGISVFSGACTTLGASIFMLAAKIIFFSQFGIFIFCTIGFSILYSLFLFITVLALIGPEGQTGSLIPLVRKVKNFVRGKKKNQVDCATCQGKGFHDKDLNTGVINAPQVTRF